MGIKAMHKEDLSDLIGKCHPYIKDVVECYGSQGALISICPKCSFILSLHVPKGMTCSGPSLSSGMFCQHKKEIEEVRSKKDALFSS